ncbi:hypothetical protein AB0I69_36115 [Streptomyces sp. NPDC050508]|uniref:hypothetical protein n=1 Tax=Streptomyces sp. NPDC050508 TaxID=3155405 RepID=UPI003419B7BE
MDLACGMPRLLDCAALHHACAGPQFTDPLRARLVSEAAWAICAYVASSYEAANERTATLVGSGPGALEMLIGLWVQVTGAVTRDGKKASTRSRGDPRPAAGRTGADTLVARAARRHHRLRRHHW